MNLSHFFSEAEARIDRWRQINAVSRAWEAAIAQGQSDERFHTEAVQLYAEIRPLEDYWAYPGPRLMATIGEIIEEHKAGVFARIVQKVSNALLTGAYRYESAAWDPLEEEEGIVPDVLPPDLQPGEAHKPYFEVLIVTPADPGTWERGRNTLRRLRRPEDSFKYEVVQVGSFEDGILGAIFNHNVQAVVIYDGFSFRSRHDLPLVREFLQRHLRIDPSSIEPGVLATTLARIIKNIRPELDIYLLTDRAVEKLAGSEETAQIRRMFHNIEEVMEVHLSILDGVSERYDTPFFSNLKNMHSDPWVHSMRFPLPGASPSSVPTGSGIWASSTGQTCFLPNLLQRPAGWTACSSRQAT